VVSIGVAPPYAGVTVPWKTLGLIDGLFAQSGLSFQPSHRKTRRWALNPYTVLVSGGAGLQRYLIGAEFVAGHRFQVAQDAGGL